MGYKLMSICIFFIFFKIRAQNIMVFLDSQKEGILSVEVQNRTPKNLSLYVDSSEINFLCEEEDIDKQNFLRMNICIKQPKQWIIPELITIIQGQQLYGNDNNKSFAEYVKESQIVLQPYEKRIFIYNIYKQKNYRLSKNTKIFKLNAKAILFDYEKLSDTLKLSNRIESNITPIKLRLMKKNSL